MPRLVGVLVLLWLGPMGVAAQEATIELLVAVPADTPADPGVYISGNHEGVGNWKPDGRRLERTESGAYRVPLKLPVGQALEYKLTRGSWQTVEKGPGGEELDNRTLDVTGDATVRIAVARWAAVGAGPASRLSTVAGDIRRHERFRSEVLGNERTVLVYLPPGYDGHAEQRYPVMYLHDGQNVFDDATSFTGEWRADETAERSIREGRVRPVILVAVANTPDRMSEYTATPDPRHGGGRGALYGRFLVEELKPFIDRTYRTLPARENTAVAGSSLGGLISLYLAKWYPEQFGMAGVLSPALWWDDRRPIRDVAGDRDWVNRVRFYLSTGTAEGSREDAERHVRNLRDLSNQFRLAGMVEGEDFLYREVAGGKHHEATWAGQFGEVLEFFFPAVAGERQE